MEAPDEEGRISLSPAAGVDFSTIPSDLDARLEEEDPEGALRPTIVNASQSWRKSEKRAFLFFSSSSFFFLLSSFFFFF